MQRERELTHPTAASLEKVRTHRVRVQRRGCRADTACGSVAVWQWHGTLVRAPYGSCHDSSVTLTPSSSYSLPVSTDATAAVRIGSRAGIISVSMNAALALARQCSAPSSLSNRAAAAVPGATAAVATPPCPTQLAAHVPISPTTEVMGFAAAEEKFSTWCRKKMVLMAGRK